MSEFQRETPYIGFEYKDLTADPKFEPVYVDGYQCFGWKLDKYYEPNPLTGAVLRFRRDRKIRNKVELTRLERQFESCVNEIVYLERSKGSSAVITALVVGIIGTSLIAGATFAYLSGLLPLMIVLAVPGFIGWGTAYFCYKKALAKKTAAVEPLIEAKYDEIYSVCEKATSLL